MKRISIFLLLLLSCNPLRHYQKVATDTDVTAKKKATIAPFIAIHFPVKEKYVKGDTIIDTLLKYDTSFVKVNDTIIKEITHNKIITKKIIDTIYMTNEAERYALQETINKYEQDIKELQDKSNKQENKIKDLRDERNILLIGVLILSVMCCFILYKILL